VAKLQKNIDGALLSHDDDRQKVIQVVKAENASQKRFAEADTLFGTKRWEDDWLRIYQYAATGGYLGNLISIVLGFSGGIFLCYQLTSNWAAAIAIGAIVVLIMEVTKSVSLREATIHILKGKQMSGMVLTAIAASMIVASAYFSVESGMKTPYFQKWVQAEANTTTLPAAPTTNEYGAKIADLRSELRSIDNERDAYGAKNKTKSVNWLKADRYESIKAEINGLQKEAATNTKEAQQSEAKQSEANTATTLSWWYWCIVILSELCVIFGYCFRPYYLYRCRELAIIEGREINRQDVLVANNATTYTPIQQQLTNEQLLAEIERLKKLQSNPSNPNNPTNKIGFQFSNTVDTVADSVDTVADNVDTVADVVEMVSTDKIIAEYGKLDEASLLGHFRQLNSNIRSWEKRSTTTAKANIVSSQKLQQAILTELTNRNKTIKLIQGRGYQVVPN